MSSFLSVSLPPAIADRLPGIDLIAEDADRLASHGVNPEHAKAAGFRRVGSAGAASLLRRTDKGDLGGILIPYVAPRELALTHMRIWLDDPLMVHKSDEATAEFLQPTGSTNWLYFLPGTTAENLVDVDLPILLCTSEADALAALALDGFLPIGFGGPWGWRGSTPSMDPATETVKRIYGPVEDLTRLSLISRTVIVCHPVCFSIAQGNGICPGFMLLRRERSKTPEPIQRYYHLRKHCLIKGCRFPGGLQFPNRIWRQTCLSALLFSWGGSE